MAGRIIRIKETDRQRLERRLTQTMLAQAIRLYNDGRPTSLSQVDFDGFARRTVEAWLRDYRMTPRK